MRKEKEQLDIQLAKEKEQNEILLAKEKEAYRKLMTNFQDLQSRSKSENSTLQGTVSKLKSDKDAAIQTQEAVIR